MLHRVLRHCLKLSLNNAHKNKLNKSVFRTPQVTREIHKASTFHCKLYHETENTFAYNILATVVDNNVNIFEGHNINLDISTVITDDTSLKTFLDQNWRQKLPSEILTAFRTVLPYCKLKSLNISEICFDELTNGFLENIEKFSDTELSEFFDVLTCFPVCGSYSSHNFHDIWSALDDICCLRLSQWSNKEFFCFGDKWYKLGLGKYCDFLYEVLERLRRRALRLSKEELVHAFFFMNVCRKRVVDFEYEDALNRKVDEMTLKELSIVAMGFFKTQSKIKIDNIIIVMIQRLKEQTDFHEILLSSIVKVLRLSSRTKVADHILDLLNYLDKKLDKLPIIALTHVALLGTTLQIEHKPILTFIAQKVAENAQNKSVVRLKDLERILLPISMFDFDPETTPDFFFTLLQELESSQRDREKIQYPRSLSSALNFLSIRNIYSYELMNKVLDNEYIDEVYGKKSKNVPRDLFCLDRSIEIECPDYTGNRIDKNKIHKAAKWLTEFSPRLSYRNKLNLSERFFVDIYNVLKKICGNEALILDVHVLPHYERPDLVLCKDRKTGQFIEPMGFQNYILGDIMVPVDVEKLLWYDIIVCGWNNCARYTGAPLGGMNMKIRQLQKIGYIPILVDWPRFGHISEEQRIEIIKKNLNVK